MGRLKLTTAEPYYTPGYSGYCPQFKYEIGRTYGASTHEILTSPKINRSQQGVLTNTLPNEEVTKTATGWTTSQEIKAMKIVNSRQQSFGNQKYVHHMIPGYSGFVPRSQKQFGARYATACDSAIADFDIEQTQSLRSNYTLGQVNQKRHPKLRLTAVKEKELQNSIEAISIKLTSKSIAKTVPISYMDDDDPNKFHKSGYTGYVPRQKEIIGLSYPISSHVATKQFHTESRVRSAEAHKPITVTRQIKSARDGRVIFPKTSGIMPHYTGHVPGMKYRIGGTFGNNSVDTLRM
ncbi:Protein FAM166B [Trichoplax sp. H2]|nr:Protein FAM166B [Trichoplax sp. H2]|eukprot:RDD44377.1 Protein FAM166B [Trichoplax sp. H2]